MNLDLTNSSNLDCNIEGNIFSMALNRPIKRGRKVRYVGTVLPEYGYSNIASTEEASAVRPVRQLQELGEASLSQPAPTLNVTEPVSLSQPTPTPTNPLSNLNLSAEVGQMGTSQTATTPTTPQTETGMGMPMGGGGGFGGGGGAEPTPEEQSGEKEGGGAGLEDKECKSNYWILGLALGAIGGYLYAKTKNKEVLKSVLIISAVGGVAGFVVDKIICKDKAVPTIIPPKTEEKK